MPHQMTAKAPKKLLTIKGRRGRASSSAKQEESDTDLADEDEPWGWIYAPLTESQAGADSDDDDDDADDTAQSRRKRAIRKAHKSDEQERKIIGARSGGFRCKIGDCVVLRHDGNASWAGIIRGFANEWDGKMGADILWFQSEADINKKRKRTDCLENERYASLHHDFCYLDTINGKAIIMSATAFNKKYPSGKIPKKSPDFGKTFLCRRGVEARTAKYTEEFVWEDIYQGNDGDLERLQEFLNRELIHSTNKFPKKRQRVDYEFNDSDDGLDDKLIETPRKKQKHSSFSTPRKPRTPSKILTPGQRRTHHVKKPLEFTPLGTRVLEADHVYSSPFQTARSKLHVSAVPTSLPCREDEFASVYSHLEAAISDGSGACIYISGTPGTGKTATVREVVAQLNASVLAEELEDFTFVEINGMKVTDPHQSYSLLWEALSGQRVSPSHALDLLDREFSKPTPRITPCVVLMDELDQLVTKNQSVMYNFFNWPGLRHSKLIVLAVANTMDLPERTLSNKISSRLGLTRITFPGYTHEQLMKIIQSRLEGVPGNIVESDAIVFASKKVAAVSGDARRCLDICRRAVELAETDALESGAVPGTPSKSAAKADKPSKSLGTVTVKTVMRAINEATTSPLQQFLRALPLSSKVLLAALVAITRRSGITESVLGRVVDEAMRMAKMDTSGHAMEFLLKDDMRHADKKSMQFAVKQSLKAPRVLAIGSSAIDLMEAGIIGLEARKGDRTGKIRLCIGEEDVKLAFKDDPEVKGLGFS